MNDTERILYIRAVLKHYSREYLLNEAPAEVIGELVEIVKTAILEGLTWTQKNPDILLNRQKSHPSDDASGTLGKWQIIES